VACSSGGVGRSAGAGGCALEVNRGHRNAVADSGEKENYVGAEKGYHHAPGENEHTKQPQSKIPAAMLVRRS
jgi:hypothetical protein